MKQIQLNNQPFDINSLIYPVLIQGKDESGASYFSVELVSQLFLAGYKLLFFSGYEMAKDLFKKILIADSNKIGEVVDNTDISMYAQYQAVLLPSKDEYLFGQCINNLPDIQERIVFVKNFHLYTKSTILKFEALTRIIIAGDIDKTAYKQEVMTMNPQSRFFFSYSADMPSSELPHLEKYQSYYTDKKRHGIVSLK